VAAQPLWGSLATHSGWGWLSASPKKNLGAGGGARPPSTPGSGRSGPPQHGFGEGTSQFF
jgi:hypothetical protein